MIKQIRKFTSSGYVGAQLFLLASIVFSVYALVAFPFDLCTLVMVVGGYFMYGCLGIVVTYHRFLTHQSYTTSPMLIKIFSLLGCFAGTGSPLAWANIHISHHLYSDKPQDPHSPRVDGLKIFALHYEVKDKTRYLTHMIHDKYQQFLHRYYFAILLGYSFVLYLIGGVYLMVFMHLMPAAITAIMSNVVNFVGHKPNWLGGYRSYHLGDDSTNNWVWAIPSWGEAWHNNHHRFPKNSSFSQRWYEFDISGLIIKFIRT